jgi:pimeloyl-ACP methyl ester carboxylesterase
MAVARLLAPLVRVVIPDLLSRGASTPRADIAYGLEDEVRRVREIVDRLELRPPVVVAGHSHGAALALAYARAEPGVRGLVLSNPVNPWTRRPIALSLLRSDLVRAAASRAGGLATERLARAILRRASGPDFTVTPEDVGAYAAPYREPLRRRALLRVLSDWRPGELADRLPDRSLVTRIFAGDQDPRITIGSVERLAGALDARLTRVPDGGHILPEQHPRMLAREIIEVLREVGELDGTC